ncbi:hypothetical protein A1O3_06291 [Capronia epimyces CBS 606.96]|uniref:Heterokaryon incompatibility domain-containing protein n=1 Tax=Capronia epimyces CBS 606.96 TaxID=1182542 RepID=W9XQJ8_9EURO|nr:uncharacterized protein A1O3_06291 [Capronia epimyces CBS 606.96]EXJ82478.1 hypothetical protein A1O3_06291 [Capronia epimyces CBS 606.96]
MQRFRRGRDERLVYHAELASSTSHSDSSSGSTQLQPQFLALRWRSLGKYGNGQPMQSLDVCYGDGSQKQIAYTLLKDTPNRPRSGRSASSARQPHIDQIAAWMKLCETTHQTCQANIARQTAHLAHPARLLDLRPDDVSPGNVRLIPYAGDEARSNFTFRYAALSYRWGSRPHHSTITVSNISDRMTEITVDEAFPKTFRDSISLCRDMAIRYLWIDALCIIQPTLSDDTDWQEQSAIMGYIYANAAITIAASGAESFEVGLYPPKGPFELAPPSCALFPSDQTELGLYLQVEAPDWVASVAESPLQTRAWVLQERIMSTRLIHCSQHAIFWECAELRASEFEPDGTGVGGLLGCSSMIPTTSGTGNEAEIRESLMHAWGSIVSDYSPRHLSVDADHLPAISAIAQQVADMVGEKYIAGLWEEDLLIELLWLGIHKNPSHRRRAVEVEPSKRGRMSGDSPLSASQSVGDDPACFVAPSWCWASVMGWVRPGSLGPHQCPAADIVRVSVKPQFQGNAFGRAAAGGYLELSARLRHNVRLQELETTEEQPPR